MKSAEQRKFDDLNYVDSFDYKVNVIIKIDVLKVIWKQHMLIKKSLRFAIYYSRS